MDVNNAIFNRRTAHIFEKKKVNEDIIINAIKAANQAPCHRLTYPWRFYSVGLEKRKKILEIALELKSKDKELSDDLISMITKKFLNPSHLLLACQLLHEDDFIRKEDYAACACSIQNLSISLASEGISTKWSTGFITREPKIYNLANIDSKREEIIGFIWIGYGNNFPMISRPSISKIYKKI